MTFTTPRIRYRNPPVVEVVCEIHFAGSSWDSTLPGQFYDAIRERFPQKREVRLMQARFTLGPEGESSADLLPGQPRVQFLNEAGDRWLQLGQDVIVVNKLRPYSRFEQWEGDLQLAIEIYRRLARPERIALVSIRHLNRIDLPATVVPLQDYFRIYPQLPESFEPHGPFLVRFQVDRGGEHQTVVTFASAPSEHAETSCFVLDLLDICSHVRFENLDEQLRLGHRHLWQAFEESCTPTLKETFGPEVEP